METPVVNLGMIDFRDLLNYSFISGASGSSIQPRPVVMSENVYPVSDSVGQRFACSYCRQSFLISNKVFSHSNIFSLSCPSCGASL